MQSGQQNFVAAHKALQSTLDELEGDLQAKLSEWEGAAQQEYLRAKAEWRAAADHMALVISNLGNVLGTGHDNYKGAEQSGVQTWSG
jgi:WXG100 family type VII secretion target